MAAKKESAPVNDAEKKFTKEQLLESERYRHCQDLLSALLKGGKTYSITEVEKRIKDFLEKEM